MPRSLTAVHDAGRGIALDTHVSTFGTVLGGQVVLGSHGAEAWGMTMSGVATFHASVSENGQPSGRGRLGLAWSASSAASSASSPSSSSAAAAGSTTGPGHGPQEYSHRVSTAMAVVQDLVNTFGINGELVMSHPLFDLLVDLTDALDHPPWLDGTGTSTGVGSSDPDALVAAFEARSGGASWKSLADPNGQVPGNLGSADVGQVLRSTIALRVSQVRELETLHKLVEDVTSVFEEQAETSTGKDAETLLAMASGLQSAQASLKRKHSIEAVALASRAGKRAKRLHDPAGEGGNGKAALKAWIFAHAANPYPSPEEKSELARVSGLSRKQLDNWLTNARRRLLKRVTRA